MNNFAIGLFSIIGLTFTFSNPTFADSKKFTRSEKKQIKCLRNVFESRRHDENTLLNAITLYEEFKKGNNIQDSCKALHKEMKNTLEKSEFGKRAEIIEKLHTESKISINTYYAVKYLVNPGYSCKTVELTASAALIVGGNLGIAIGQCTSSTGRVYALVAPKAGYDLGLFAGVLAEKCEFSLKPRHIVQSSQDNDVLLVGFGLAVGMGKIATDDAHGSAGVGLGLGFEASYHLNLRLIQIGNNFTHF